MRLPNAPVEPVSFLWNNTRIEGRKGDTVAAALHAAGIRRLTPSRKFHEPRGLSGSFIAGHMATVDSVPNCRLDQMILREGMEVVMQGVWPSPGFDLFRCAGLIPRKRLRGGFEHPTWIPDQSVFWHPWERMLAFAAGGAKPPKAAEGSVPEGNRIHADIVIIGGGSVGVAEARAAAETMSVSVVLVTQGTLSETLPKNVIVYPLHRVFALYNGGRLVAAAPIDPREPALLIDADHVVLATGARSTPPVVRGAALPGVLDAGLAMQLALDHGVAAGARVAVIGTSRRHDVTEQLETMGVHVVGSFDVAAVASIQGRGHVTGIETGDRSVPCDAVVHAGPWRPDPSLPFQASWSGELRLTAGEVPDNVRVAGWASEAPEPVSFGARDQPDAHAFVCPCMDVTVEEVLTLVARGTVHVEEIKRLTGCGMGPCQGVPCWDLLAAVVGWATGKPTGTVGHPTYRPPRAALTFGQAAGLVDATEVAP